MEQKLDTKKRIIIIIIAVLILGVGTTLAYIIAHLQDSAIGNASVTSDTTDNLRFNVDKDITLNPTQFNVVEGGGGLSDSAVGSATLLANSTDNNATYNYYVYFLINSNNYIYTTDDNKPEIVLTITDSLNQIVTQVDGLEYVEVTNADGSEVKGFDITTKSGLYNVASLYEITSASSTDATVQEWTFTVTFINLNTNQAENGGKTLEGEVILSREPRYTLANYIIENVYVEDGVNGLYYHDEIGTYTNAELEAGDNSYRYAGASDMVNNYVCFGSTITPCPDENLYRIIGVFNDSGEYQVKLIKADYVTSTMLGIDSRDYVGSYVDSWGESEIYKGNMIQSNIAVYRWNYDTSVSIYGSNDWTTSELNIINLNTNYWNYLGSTWQNLIATTTWHLGGMTSYNNTAKEFYDGERNNAGYGSNPTTYTDEIGLMYISDYGFAASPSAWTNSIIEYSGDKWMYMGLNEWTIVPYSSSPYALFQMNIVGSLSPIHAFYGAAIRPTFYLKSNIAYSEGDGTIDNPYRVAV